MAPPITTFPASDLQEETHTTARGGYRKGWNGDLQGCELLEMLQYRCGVDASELGKGAQGVARCWPVERLFRRCKDSKGTFMVETTAWEKSVGREAKES